MEVKIIDIGIKILTSFGVLVHANSAPKRLPTVKKIRVAKPTNPIVQGRARPTSSDTVDGKRAIAKPRSPCSRLPI